jgi:2-dehydropantoate 2-reductase
VKISIVGSGAMGSLFGGLLAESGNEVTLIDVNDAHIGAIRAKGLRLATDSGDRQIATLKALRPYDVADLPDLPDLAQKCAPSPDIAIDARHALRALG